MRYLKLELKLMEVDGRNLRSRLFESSLKDLAQSLKLHGQLYPVLVIPKGEKFAVMDGFRRVEAARLLGWTEMFAGILEESDADELQVAYVGNFQREGINYVDEAQWLAAVLDNTELDVDRLAAGLGRSAAYVRSRLDVLRWPEALLAYLRSTEVSFSVAREYARLGEGKDLENALIYDRSVNPSARQAASYVAAVLFAGEDAKVGEDVGNLCADNASVKKVTCDGCKKGPPGDQLFYGGFGSCCLAESAVAALDT